MFQPYLLDLATATYDICISIDVVNGADTGKISVITPPSMFSVSPKVYIEVIPFRLLLPIQLD
jgi:hypothetical protein